MQQDGDPEEADGGSATLDGGGDGDAEPSDAEGVSTGFERWRRTSAIGGVGTGIARGLQAVFAPPADEIAIVAAVPGEPPDADERIRVILDLDDPSNSVAIVPEASNRPDGPLDQGSEA